MTFKHGPIEVNYSTCVFHHALWVGPSVCCNKTSRMRMDYKLAALEKGAGQRRTVGYMYLYIIIFSVYLACVIHSDPPVGGYDYEFVDGSVPSRYQCTICMKILRDARLTECCGQHYCDSCLTQWLRRKRTCPYCRKADLQSMLNKEKIREINELRIRCTNREKGCAWVGELGALKGHLESDKGCGYEIVKVH